MDKDTQATLRMLAPILADQLKINADLRAEIEALRETWKEFQPGFVPRYESHLETARRSESYRRQVETALLVRRTVGEST